MKLHQITEDDLRMMEQALPKIMDACFPLLNSPELQVLFQECKEVLSNVRWNYGPPSSVEVIKL